MHYSSVAAGGGVTTFGIIVNALVMSTMLPYSVVIWGYATPAYASPQTSAVTGGLVTVPSSPPASLQEQADLIRRLPDDVMRAVIGGPEGQESPPDLKSPELVLASFSPSAAGTLASRIVPSAAADSCTGLMDAVMAEAAAGDVEGAIAAAFPVLSRFPDSYEAERARLVVENQLSGATPTQLATLASTVLTRGAPVTATEGAAACRIVWTHAQTSSVPEAYDYVISTAGSMLSNWPNAPEAFHLVPMYLGSLDALGDNSGDNSNSHL